MALDCKQPKGYRKAWSGELNTATQQHHQPTVHAVIDRLKDLRDPGGCTQEPINGARVECRAFHSDRVLRWCRTCILTEAIDMLDALSSDLHSARHGMNQK